MKLSGASAALAASLSLAFVGPAAAQPQPIDEVIAAERAFAAETREIGFKRGFLRYVAPDGFIFAPGPRPARPNKAWDGVSCR